MSESLGTQIETPKPPKSPSLAASVCKGFGLCILGLVLILMAGADELPMVVRIVVPILAGATILTLGFYDARSKRRLGQGSKMSIFSCAVGLLTVCGALLALDFTEWHIVDGTGPVRSAAVSILHDLSSGKQVGTYSFKPELLDLGVVDAARFTSVTKTDTYKGKEYELSGTAKFSHGGFDHFKYVKLQLIQQGDSWGLTDFEMAGAFSVDPAGF